MGIDSILAWATSFFFVLSFFLTLTGDFFLRLCLSFRPSVVLLVVVGAAAATVVDNTPVAPIHVILNSKLALCSKAEKLDGSVQEMNHQGKRNRHDNPLMFPKKRMTGIQRLYTETDEYPLFSLFVGGQICFLMELERRMEGSTTWTNVDHEGMYAETNVDHGQRLQKIVNRAINT